MADMFQHEIGAGLDRAAPINAEGACRLPFSPLHLSHGEAPTAAAAAAARAQDKKASDTTRRQPTHYR